MRLNIASENEALASLLGGRKETWKVTEIGDGNLNYVYRICGPSQTVIVKKAPPFLRKAGESWPLSAKRSYYEARALEIYGKLTPDSLPKVFHYDSEEALIVMECLEPHLILRKGLIKGESYPCFAEHMASHLAKTLFGTSDWALSAAEKKALLQDFAGNAELCHITEELIFTNPYMEHPTNKINSAGVEAVAHRFRNSVPLKLAITLLKHKFLTSGEALIHGDLHTGSILATESDTRVIDPEFAFFGPMGFDTGALVANLFLAYFSQAGHRNDPTYKKWILEQIVKLWNTFYSEFISLWNSSSGGEGLPEAFTNETPSLKEAVQKQFMVNVYADTLGYAGAKMIRRILGFARVEDLESIQDKEVQALCEQKALLFAYELLTSPEFFPSIEAVVRCAEAIEKDTPEGIYADLELP